VILEAAGRKVSTPSDVVEAVKAAKDSRTRGVLLRIKSGNRVSYVAIKTRKG
jgi:hypothetical protein